MDRESSYDLRSSAALDLARSCESDGRSRQSCLDICDREVCADVVHWAPFPASWVSWLLRVSQGIADQGAHCVCWDRPGWLLQPGPYPSPFITTTHRPVLCQSCCQNPRTAPFQPAVAPTLQFQAGHRHSKYRGTKSKIYMQNYF